MATRGLLVLGLVAAVTGCQPHYSGLVLHYINGAANFDDSGLEIAEGTAVAVKVKPTSDSAFEDYEVYDLVSMTSFNEGVMFVARAGDVDTFAFVGVRTGKTAIDVFINDRRVDTFDARVLPQGAR